MALHDSDRRRIRVALDEGWDGPLGLRVLVERIVSEVRDDEAKKRAVLENRISDLQSDLAAATAKRPYEAALKRDPTS